MYYFAFCGCDETLTSHQNDVGIFFFTFKILLLPPPPAPLMHTNTWTSEDNSKESVLLLWVWGSNSSHQTWEQTHVSTWTISPAPLPHHNFFVVYKRFTGLNPIAFFRWEPWRPRKDLSASPRGWLAVAATPVFTFPQLLLLGCLPFSWWILTVA